MSKHREILLQGNELAEMLTESQAEEVHKAMERVRMGNSGYYYELARLVIERDALNMHNDKADRS